MTISSDGKIETTHRIRRLNGLFPRASHAVHVLSVLCCVLAMLPYNVTM
jgi:hypothetical protein